MIKYYNLIYRGDNTKFEGASENAKKEPHNRLPTTEHTPFSNRGHRTVGYIHA